VQVTDSYIGHVMLVETLENTERLFGSSMRYQPSRRLRNDEQNDHHRNQKHTLQDSGNPPRKGSRIALGKSIIDPVCQEDAKVQSGYLHANICFNQTWVTDMHIGQDLHKPRVAFGLNSA